MIIVISKDFKFELSEIEYEKLFIWWNESFNDRSFGAIGGGLTIHITPTSIGEIVEAECGNKKITLREL